MIRMFTRPIRLMACRLELERVEFSLRPVLAPLGPSQLALIRVKYLRVLPLQVGSTRQTSGANELTRQAQLHSH